MLSPLHYCSPLNTTALQVTASEATARKAESTAAKTSLEGELADQRQVQLKLEMELEKFERVLSFKTQAAQSADLSAQQELSSLKVANTNLELQLKDDQSAMAALRESVEGFQLEMQHKESRNMEQIEELNQKLIMADVSFKAADEKSSKLEVCVDCLARSATLSDSHWHSHLLYTLSLFHAASHCDFRYLTATLVDRLTVYLLADYLTIFSLTVSRTVSISL